MAQNMRATGNDAKDQLKGGAAPEAGVDALAILNALPGQCALLDGHGAILAANTAWYAFAAAGGASRSQVGPGINYLQVCDTATGAQAGDAEAFATGLREVLSGRRAAFTLEYPCDSPVEQRWFLARIAAVHAGAARALVTHEEIASTGPRDYEAARQVAGDSIRLQGRLREAIAARDDFLAVAAHELRTPITALQGGVQLLLRQLDREPDGDAAQQRALLAMIDQQVGRLTRLVTQLLDVSRIEGRQLSLERRPTDIAALLRGVVDRMQAGTDRHMLRLRAAPGIAPAVDQLRLEQVIENLLANAIAYSPEGGPIDIVADAGDRTLEIAVRDRGIGIPPERRACIFDRFSRAHAEQQLGGLGLGLYISRQIVLLHGGTIEAQAAEGGGTRMVVRLPL
jgi:signal transduction histidine kinase